jgi:NTE family protein
MHAVTLLLEQRAILETRAYAGTVDLHVMPPLCPLSISAMDFSHAATLIGRARRSTGRWLDSGSDQLPYAERFLFLYGHRLVDRSTPPAVPVAQPVSPALAS